MRGSSRHGASRPDWAGGRGAGPRGDSRGARRDGKAAPGGGRGLQQGAGAGRDRGQAVGQSRRPPAAAPDSERLAGLLGPVVGAAGMDLESVRAGAAGSRLLIRVVVDADGGVALDDIADISRELSAALDQADLMGDAPYTLEVSSPGVDRPLTEPRHWRRAVGRLVRVPPASGPGGPPARGQGAAVVEGRVLGAGDDEVTLDIDGVERTFSYRELGPGRVQVEFGRLADEISGLDGGEPDGH